MSEFPRGLHARRLIQALIADGFTLQRSRGSHRMYRHPDGWRVVVSVHHLSDEFPVGTLKAILADAGWGTEDLRRLGLLD